MYVRLFVNRDDNPYLYCKILRILKLFSDEDQIIHIYQTHRLKAGDAEDFVWCHRLSSESRCP